MTRQSPALHLVWLTSLTDNLAPTIYWTQLEGALAVVSACLPTMRPLFQGLSPESMVGRFRIKIPRYWKLPKGSQPRSSTSLQKAEGDHSSLNKLTKSDQAVSVGTDIESFGMDDVESRIAADVEGIRVDRDLSYDSETL